MPDNTTIERTIYKLEIDDSDYIKKADSMSASTKKFADQQEAANKRLKENEAALKVSAEIVEKNRKALEAYTGADKKYKEQLEANLKTSQQSHVKLTELVANVRKSYEAANKAAQDFEKTSQRATKLQQQTTGGKIPTGPAPVIPQILPAFGDFDLKSILSESSIEFERLRTAIAGAEERMASLNAEDEEFKQLALIVDKGKIALQQYDDAAKKAGGSTLSLRTQIRQGRDELVRLEEAGKGATKEYFELEKRVAKLTDAFGDQQQRIKILASDTKLLDFGKGAITAATSAFQTYASISILAGDESAELQKKTMQLFAAMQLLQSLEQLSNLTRREGVLATLAQSGAQSVYTAVVGASTGALKAFRIALLSTGIIGVVVGIGFLVSKFLQLKNAAKEAGAQQKLLLDINNKAVESYASEVAQLDVLRRKLNDLTLPQKDRIAFAKEYNKTADEGNKLDLKQIDNIDLLNAAIGRQIEKIKERAIAQAAANVNTEKATTLFQLQNELASKVPDFVLNLDKIDKQIEEAQKTVLANLRKRTDFTRDVRDQQLLRLLKDIKDANEEFNRAATLTATLTPEPPPTKTETSIKGIENEFARKKAELDEKLAALTRKEADNESKIRIEFAARLSKEQLEIDKLLNADKLTKPEAKILKDINIDINRVELDKALADFRKKITDARNKLNDELQDLQNKANQDTLNLLQNDFDRRAALIDFNEKKEIADAKEATEERLAALELDKLLIGEQAYQDARKIITDTGTQAILTIEQKAALARQDLAADIFKQSLDAFQAGLNQGLIARDEELAKLIRSASDKFLTGKITFEQFQKELTAIQRREESIRRDIEIANQTSRLAALDRQIESTIDKTTKQYADLLKLRDDYNKELQAKKIEDSVKDAEDGNDPDPDKNRAQKVAEYANAVGALADSVIAFWQKANEAESAALDRSITLQERRVEAAQRIAERGNAQYLKQEEDKLKEIEIARENAARKQLGIDAALQASQLLVGITGAIAKLAGGPLGAAQVIGEIAIIFGALATGYALVKSLQGNQPRLAKGKKYVTRDGHPSGTDTIPAWLNEGEAVIPAEKNKAYHPAVAAIYDGTVPAEHLNNFVKTYHKVKPIPQPNYQRIKDAAELHISSDGKMAVLLTEHSSLLKENNELQRQILKKNIRVENKIDRDGVSSMVYDFIEQKRIDRKT